jgi:hypothetical protein
MARGTKGLRIPAFASDEEEMLFWDSHDPSLYFTRRVGITESIDTPTPEMLAAIAAEEARHARGEATAQYERLVEALYRAVRRKLLAEGHTYVPKGSSHRSVPRPPRRGRYRPAASKVRLAVQAASPKPSARKATSAAK